MKSEKNSIHDFFSTEKQSTSKFRVGKRSISNFIVEKYLASTKFILVTLFVALIGLGSEAEGASAPLCGFAFSIHGVNQVEKITLNASSSYPLPRDPFYLSMFDIDDQDFLLLLVSVTNLNLNDISKASHDPVFKNVKADNIMICLDKFEANQIRSSASLYLSVKKVISYRVWKKGELLVSHSQP